MFSITSSHRRHIGSGQLTPLTAFSSTCAPTRLTIRLLLELRSDWAVCTPLENYYCTSPILVIAFELQQRDTSLILYLFASDHVFLSFLFFYLIPASLKSSLLPHSYTNTTSEDDPVQYSRSVKPDFWLYYSNKALHSILRQQNSMWQNKRILSCIFNNKDL